MKRAMTDDTILACERVADVPEPPLLSRRGRCKVCNMQVWIAHSSPRADLIYCMRCALDRMMAEAAQGSPIEITPLTPKQINDLARWRRRRSQ